MHFIAVSISIFFSTFPCQAPYFLTASMLTLGASQLLCSVFFVCLCCVLKTALQYKDMFCAVQHKAWLPSSVTDCEKVAVITLYTVQFVKCEVWCAVCSVQCIVCSVQCAVCLEQCVVCSVQCAVCSVHCGLCSVYCAVCSVQCALALFWQQYSVLF